MCAALGRTPAQARDPAARRYPLEGLPTCEAIPIQVRYTLWQSGIITGVGVRDPFDAIGRGQANTLRDITIDAG
jgi:hypothetical protein